MKKGSLYEYTQSRWGLAVCTSDTQTGLYMCVCVYTLYSSATHNRSLPSNKTVVLVESLLLQSINQSLNHSIANSDLLLQIDDGSLEDRIRLI